VWRSGIHRIKQGGKKVLKTAAAMEKRGKKTFLIFLKM
jgi:hypothetical protein